MIFRDNNLLKRAVQISLMEKETDFKPFGPLLRTYTALNPTGENFTFQIYKADMNGEAFEYITKGFGTF